MKGEPPSLQPGAPLQRDPLAAIAVRLAPIVLEGRYRVLVGALRRLGRPRRGRWGVGFLKNVFQKPGGTAARARRSDSQSHGNARPIFRFDGSELILTAA
jgi:hypothetical protein